MAMRSDARSRSSQAPLLRVVGQSDAVLWGLNAAERMRRLFQPFGIDAATSASGGTVLLAHADYLLEGRVAEAVAGVRNTVLTVFDAQRGAAPFAAHVDAAAADRVASLLARGERLSPGDLPPGIVAQDVSDLVPEYNYMLRKRETPCVIPLRGVASREVEWRTFMATYKGVTDAVTKYVWPWPAFWATRWAAHVGITPNAVTSLGLVLVFLASWLFATDHLWLGLAAAWVMTFLDTVDGKLARTTLTSSKSGALYDHAIDYIHQPFWWAAWWWGLRDNPGADVGLLDACAVIAVGGYAVVRFIEETFKRIYKVRIHVWQRVDSIFRLVTARRNPNLVILTAALLFGAPAAGFVLLAAWTAFSVVFHLVRFLQAGARRIGGKPLRSWLEQGA